MKILPVEKIREADAYTILHEPIADIDLMERAAASCFYWLLANIPHERKVLVFCGTGNNGGDGLAIARMLIAKEYEVITFLAGDPAVCSASCRTNYERLPGPKPLPLKGEADLPPIGSEDIVIDALFGSGLGRPAGGFHARIIDHINASGALVVAIDVPSGLFCDRSTIAEIKPAVVKADYTLTFSPPKLAFFFPENDAFAGDWQLLDIGLSREYLDAAEVRNYMTEKADCEAILKKRNKFAHKGHFGHALLLAGSAGKLGAAVLAARGCLRAGPGLVTLHAPSGAVPVMQSAVPEAMLSIDPSSDHFTAVPDLGPYTAIGTGPGIGTSETTARALKLLIQNTGIPLILDADAINILAENKTWLGFLPKGCIFTPHPKEFERLAGKSSNHFERNQMQRDFSVRHQCYVILKGAHTAITDPAGRCYFNTTGNPGMATGGSGDVLTGILTGLFAQGYSALETCLLGVYIHGLAGDLAFAEEGFEALTAGDIIKQTGKAFQTLYGKF